MSLFSRLRGGTLGGLLFLRVLILYASVPLAQGSISRVDEGCDLYLAKSGIPNAGWGVFAARNYKMGDRIGEPSVGIPFFDKSKLENATEYGALKEFLWPSHDIGAFSEANEVDLFLLGPAALANHHPALENVIPGGLIMDRESQRGSNPMAGSFSAYHGFTLIAKRNILAGEELFVDKDRNRMIKESSLLSRHVASAQAYKRADELVKDIYNAKMNFTAAQWVDVLYRIREEILQEPDAFVSSLLPQTFDELKRAAQVGTAKNGLEERRFHLIRGTGHCLGRIREGPSRILGAGRGAFAVDGFSKGDVVSFVPLVEITNSSAALAIPRVPNAPNASKQMLTNYCFGHARSDLMLCPTTEVAMANHDGSEPNIAVRWAERDEKTWRFVTGPLDDLKVDPTEIRDFTSRLAFEYVALEDINAGDELVLDYGESFQVSLTARLAGGVPPVESKHNREHSLNRQLDRIVPSAELSVLKEYSYECELYPNAYVRGGEPEWEEFASNRAIDRSNWAPAFTAWYKWNPFSSWYPCRVQEAEPSDPKLFRAEIMFKPMGVERVFRRLRNIPADRIRYVDGPYHSDQHLPWSFRQSLSIPDSLMPFRWETGYPDVEELPDVAHANFDVKTIIFRLAQEYG